MPYSKIVRITTQIISAFSYFVIFYRYVELNVKPQLRQTVFMRNFVLYKRQDKRHLFLNLLKVSVSFHSENVIAYSIYKKS